MGDSARQSVADPARAERIVVTGGSGTLGRHVLERIATRADAQVLALVRGSSRLNETLKAVSCERVDFQDGKAAAEAIGRFQPTAVIHCAAGGMQLPRPDWLELVQFNVNVSLRLCEITARVPNCRFVYVSSGLAYRDQGRPLREDDPLDSQHPYAATKAAADMLVRARACELHMPLTVVRPFSFSGSGDTGSRLIPSLLRAAEQKRPLALSPGDQIRDHCAVNDIAEGIALAATRRDCVPAKSEVFNFGSGNCGSLRELIEGIVEELGLEVTLDFGARDYAPFEPRYLVADTARARALLRWQPRTRFAYAVWQLARESFPSLKINQPERIP
jgi:nucleoside-diphosphate-sugar epimerase